MSKKSENFKFNRQDMLEYQEYIDQLDPAERKWIKDFYLETYAQTGYFKDKDLRLLKSEEAQKEANRNHNMLKSEVMELNRSESGKLFYAGEFDNFLSDVSDEQDWKMHFSQGGPTLALKEIMNQALTDLDNKSIDRKITLARFHSKMVELGKMIRSDKKAKKAQEEIKNQRKKS